MIAIKTILLYLLSAASVNTTEVQINICENFSVVTKKLDLQKWTHQDNQFTQFIENKNLDFYKQGWVLKIEKKENSDTAAVVLKKNYSFMSAALRISAATSQSPLKSAKCEYDLHGTEKKLACKIKNKISLRDFDKAIRSHSFNDLLNDDQKKWFKHEAGVWPHQLEVSSDFIDQDYTKPLALDLTQSPATVPIEVFLGFSRAQAGQEYIELSARPESLAEKITQTKLIELLQSHDVQLCADQGSIHTLDKLKSFWGN